ncbi:hypothetical protein [uncultured Maribacter sp.]|uniref:hypothetical protein n=1 Tax=uncultured Maribacter sp. TaxID=431308 RepID=UPI002606C46E|nr:hypothetical protein [uncultured Maribacter sp.]
MKVFARIILLFLWLFAVTAPSIITLCDVENTIVITNLNEEEQESGKKSPTAEEKFVKENSLDFSIVAILNNTVNSNFNMAGYKNLSLEVLSPPPECLN